MCGENSDHRILIRKDDFKIYKFEGKQKALDRLIA
jgi:hypothetical protein